MKRFSLLYRALDSTNSTLRKVAALREYFADSPAEDAAWALWILLGGKLSRIVSGRELRGITAQLSGLPLWIVEESYEIVGDLAETCAIISGDAPDLGDDTSLAQTMTELIALRGAPLAERSAAIADAWAVLPKEQRLLWNKLLTGSLRVGVARSLVIRALAASAAVPEAEMSHRIIAYSEPTAERYAALLAAEVSRTKSVTPYPFFLAYALQDGPASLGDPREWCAEWKWDGIRAQLIRRDDRVLLWSRGEEAVTEQFPEIVSAAAALPVDLVLDGEIVAWSGERPLPFGALQRRLGRKRIGEALLREVPVAFIAYDLLEKGGLDIRAQPFEHRRRLLEEIVASSGGEILRFSPRVPFQQWEELTVLRETARDAAVEGFMIKRLDSEYGVGRRRGPWWKWKVDPYSVDAVLVYAQRGHGRRAGLYTDLTFAVWDGETLVPVAKAYSGLSDEEFAELNVFIRKNTTERFGPVRSVTPELVFEIGFEGIRRSSRHRSGIALRFPRMLRWRRDKPAKEADTIATLESLLPNLNES